MKNRQWDITAPAVRIGPLVGALITSITLLVAGAVLSGCNTTAGAGEDISAGGHAVTRGAEQVKSKI